MNIVVVGQGAVGLLWYVHLRNGQQNSVSLLCSQSANRQTTQGQFIDLAKTLHRFTIDYATEKELASADVIIFCLKAYQLESAFSQYLTRNLQHIPLILCHNGMIQPQLLPQGHCILSMLITHGAKRLDNYKLEHTGQGLTDIGTIQGELTNQVRENLVDTLSFALPNVYWHENIVEKQWIKLAINCVINPLTAIYNCDNGDVATRRFNDDVDAIINEVVLIALSNNVHLSKNTLKDIVINVAKNTSANCSSMRADVLAHRKTEIEHINGFICQQGIIHHIDTAMNNEILAKINAIEHTYQNQ